MLSLDKYFKECLPKEACGVITPTGFIGIKNIAKSNDTFVMEPAAWVRATITQDIRYVFHNHINSSCIPSFWDIEFCNKLAIPFIIFEYPSMNYHVIKPSAPLLGREYEFGKTDCLALAIDYYRAQGLDVFRKEDYLDDWWHFGKDYFTEEHIQSYGFSKVDNLQENDLLIFKVSCDVNNHCGVYVGGGKFLHHAVNRLSARDDLYPRWNKYITGIYRYDANSIPTRHFSGDLSSLL